MVPVALNSLIDDPLAGCQPFLREPNAGTSMLRMLLMRLRIFYNEKASTAIGDQIIAESEKVKINKYEYIINEVLYEIRQCRKGFGEMYETVVINDWSKSLMKKKEIDTVLDFISEVKKNRASRKRNY